MTGKFWTPERELSTLYRLSEIILSSRAFDDALQEIVNEIGVATGFPIVSIEFFDEARQKMVFGGVRGIPLPNDNGPPEIPLEETLSGIVARTGLPLVETDTPNRPEYRHPWLRTHGTRTFCGVPMKVGPRVIGVLSLAHTENVQPDDRMVQRITILANYISSFVERMRAEKALSLGREHLFSLLQNMPLMMSARDKEGSFVFWNRESEQVTGYAASEITGNPRVSEILYPDAEYRRQMMAEWRQRGNDYREWEWRITCKDGSVKVISWSNISAHFPIPGWASWSVGVDVTARKLTEEVLGEMNETLNAIVQASPLAIMTLDAEGVVGTWNPAAEKIFGWTAEEAVGQYQRFVPDDKREESQQLREQVLRGEGFTGMELTRCNKDGKLINVSVSTAPLRNVRGEVNGLVSVIDDVTRQKRMEEELRQAVKMEAVGRLAGGIAHDFNNLLTAINGYCDLLLFRMSGDEPWRKEIEEIRKAGERATSLTRQLLAFSRRQMLQPKVLDLNEVVASMEIMLRRCLGEDIELHTRLMSGAWKVIADPGQIEQVLMNLAVNARDAMPCGGKLTIETENVTLDGEFIQGYQHMAPGSYLRLSVKDTGCGMDEHTMGHLFEPFFTTKEKGKGTGLGLSTVYGIVQQSEGCIWVKSEPERGTALYILLPRCEKADISAGGKPGTEEGRAPTGTETVLVVEDSPMVRDLVCEILTIYGYFVLPAVDGEEALKIWDSDRDRIDMVLSDVVMPGMSGPELTERILANDPAAKVLFMSGYSEEWIIQHRRVGGEFALIQKPFSPEGLARKVRAVLDGR